MIIIMMIQPQQHSQPTVQTMVEQYMWMMIPTLVHVLVIQKQNASFKCLLSIVQISGGICQDTEHIFFAQLC